MAPFDKARSVDRACREAEPGSQSPGTLGLSVTSSNEAAGGASTKVLVTGANGFIGSQLCASLSRLPELEIFGLVRAGSDLSFLEGLDRLRLLSGDLTEPEGLSRAARGISVIYNVAGLVADWGPWAEFRAANVDGVRNLLEAARQNDVRRVVHLSSVSVYGFPGGRGIDEDTQVVPRPHDAYIHSKSEGERLVMQANDGALQTTVVRPAGVYGPNDRTTTAKLAAALLAGRFAYVDRGRHLMAPVYVGNLVELLRLAADSVLAPGQAFNAVDDGLVTWRDYIEWLCADLGCAPPRLSVPAAVAWPLGTCMEATARIAGLRRPPPITRFRLRAVTQDNHYSNAKAKRLLGWQPSVSTRVGVRRAAHWYLEQQRKAIDPADGTLAA